jgi:predicted enzyme related to lactoylglutathione lyase
MEIPAVDARQSAVFYEKVLGWNLDPRDTGDPRFADAAGHLIGR